MANKLISEMGLPKPVANLFAARNLKTSKDALSLTEFELMELLDMGLADVVSAVSHISAIVSPPYQTALYLMEQRLQKEQFGGHLPTRLRGLDNALFGGIPFGVLTEIVGPPGIGKTQLFPVNYKNRSVTSLQQIKVLLLQQQVKLLVIDSMAALVSGEQDQQDTKLHSLGWHISFIKSLAEFSRIPVVVTNQVRSQCHEPRQYSFQAHKNIETYDGSEKYDTHLVAALGINWAHAVTIRLVLEAKSGQRYIKVAKSPMSAPMAFAFIITSSGIMLLDDDGMELGGQDISTIHYQGCSDIINFDGGKDAAFEQNGEH
ncbi:DNA repair protein RAD51 homolog 2 isoform X3 [Euphorbia lathyris]|uniref:DNA repair protein RAD51 homolog 2 isoform X3 n=1 Tax=Euphorbia lathyris TaxID=212925 RepID=UPI00331408D4